jgi:hypothetical protein
MPHVHESIDGQLQRIPHSMTPLARINDAIRASISASLASASARLEGRPGASSANEDRDETFKTLQRLHLAPAHRADRPDP